MKLSEPSLMADMLKWIASEPRAYRDVMDAWRTSCPRLSIWEDAVDHGFVARTATDEGEMVRITDAGRRFLFHKVKTDSDQEPEKWSLESSGTSARSCMP